MSIYVGFYVSKMNSVKFHEMSFIYQLNIQILFYFCFRIDTGARGWLPCRCWDCCSQLCLFGLHKRQLATSLPKETNVSRHPVFRRKSDRSLSGFTFSTLTGQAFIVQPGCSKNLSLSHGDLVLTPNIDFCETHPLLFIAPIHLTPSFDQVFKHVPPSSSQFHVHIVGKARRSVMNSFRIELAEFSGVKLISPQARDQLTKPNADSYYSFSPVSSAALSASLLTCTAVCFSLLSSTVSLLTFSLSCTLFHR